MTCEELGKTARIVSGVLADVLVALSEGKREVAITMQSGAVHRVWAEQVSGVGGDIDSPGVLFLKKPLGRGPSEELTFLYAAHMESFTYIDRPAGYYRGQEGDKGSAG